MNTLRKSSARQQNVTAFNMLSLGGRDWLHQHDLRFLQNPIFIASTDQHGIARRDPRVPGC